MTQAGPKRHRTMRSNSVCWRLGEKTVPIRRANSIVLPVNLSLEPLPCYSVPPPTVQGRHLAGVVLLFAADP